MTRKGTACLPRGHSCNGRGRVQRVVLQFQHTHFVCTYVFSHLYLSNNFHTLSKALLFLSCRRVGGSGGGGPARGSKPSPLPPISCLTLSGFPTIPASSCPDSCSSALQQSRNAGLQGRTRPYFMLDSLRPWYDCLFMFSSSQSRLLTLNREAFLQQQQQQQHVIPCSNDGPLKWAA